MSDLLKSIEFEFVDSMKLLKLLQNMGRYQESFRLFLGLTDRLLRLWLIQRGTPEFSMDCVIESAHRQLLSQGLSEEQSFLWTVLSLQHYQALGIDLPRELLPDLIKHLSQKLSSLVRFILHESSQL